MDRQNFQKTTYKAIYLLLAAMLMTSCALPGLPKPVTESTVTPPPTPEPLPPVLVEVSPLDGSQLGPDEPITFYFSKPMDHNSVEAALYGLPPGSHSWSDDSTLTFTPKESYQIDAEITVAILSSAKDAQGLTMTNPVTLTFYTPPLLTAINVLPEPASSDVDPKAAVAVTFNQPVVPLGEENELPNAFSLEPTTNGRGEWLSTSTYIFYPDPALAGGETYNVSLNTDLVSTSGSLLDLIGSSMAWSFQTALPRLVSIQPSNEQTLGLDAEITLNFNQAMNPASTESGIAFLNRGTPITGTVSWNEDYTKMTFKPDVGFARNSMYTVRLTQQATAANGTPLVLEQEFDYYTYGNFTVNGSDPGEGEAKTGTGSLRVFFTAPPKRVENIDELVQLDPEIPNQAIYIDGTTLNVSGFYTPESEYTLTISPDLTDKWDQPLDEAFELNFETAPAEPSLSMPFWNDIFFVRPDEPVLQANATNIQRADVSIASITFSDFQVLTGPEGYDAFQTFAPPNPATYSETYRLAPSRNERIVLPLARTRQELETGFYFVSVDSPQLNQSLGAKDIVVSYAGPNDRRYLIAASYLNLTFKIGATDALLWATDLRTSEPVSAPFIIYDSQGNPVVNAETDEQGLWSGAFTPQTEPWQSFTVVMSEPGQEAFGVAQSTWNNGISPWEYGINLRPQTPELRAYLYTDRPIYRPGQKVYFRGVLRQAFNARYELPDAASIQLELHDNNGRILQKFDFPLSPYGTFNGEYQLSAEAQPGYYSLNNDDLQLYLYFDVAEYRKPEIELEIAFEKEQFRAGEQVQAESDANYYFGSPARNIDVQWSLYERPTSFYLPGYQTGIYDDSWLAPAWFRGGNFGRTLDSGTTSTDLEGKLDLTFADIPKEDAPQLLTLELTAQDESGFPVSARTESVLHPANFYIGLRPDQWVAQSGVEIGFDVFTVDWEANVSPTKILQAEFSQVRWERIDPPPEDLYGIPTFEMVSTLVGSSNLSTGVDGKARLSFKPEEPGTFLLDVSGGGARTQVLIWVTGAQNAVWPNLLSDQLKLTADQTDYQPGQTASIFIPNPFGEPAQALVTVERGEVMKAEVLTLGASGSTYSLELTDEHAPNVYVSATLLGPENQFRQGYAEIKVKPTAQELQVELTARPEINEPRGEMTLQLRVTDSTGQPVEGEFSLSVVDKAVLALADPNSQDILPAFYGEQYLGITTGLSLANYTGRYMQQPLGGGGGGGGEGLPFVREQFPDTAYWNPSFITDSNGAGQVTITLPDNLTTWFIETRGLTLDTRVGQADTEVVTTKPLLIRPVTPRFLVQGDHVELSAIVHNNTDDAMQVTVNMDATGFTLDEPDTASQNIEVPANDRVLVTWWGTADKAEEADLIFAVNGKSGTHTFSDAAKPGLGALPILAYVAPQTFVTAGVLTDEATRQEVISLPRTFSPIGGRLDVEMSPSLAASILNSLEALPTPSCSCNNEAVLSYFLPNLETYRALQASGLDNPDLKARLDDSLNDSVSALVRNQNFDGGWGWIRSSDSDPYMSSYVLFGLGRARQAGVNIPDETFESAHEFLREDSLSDPTLYGLQPWELDRLAFTLFALQGTSGLQESDGDILNTLYDKRDQLNPWSKALLALSLEGAFFNDSRARDLISNLETNSVRTGSSSNWESDGGSWRNPGTPLYTTAVVAYALAQRDPSTPVLIEAVRYLSENRNALGRWGSTYESAWVILALTEAMKGFGELQADFSFSATLNGAQLADGKVSGTEILNPVNASVPLEYLSPNAPNSLVISRESGLGRLYYRASLLLNRPVETVQPLNKGMNVSRVYNDGNCKNALSGETAQSKGCAPLSTLELASPSGTMPNSKLTARLTLTLPNDAYYVMLEDYIPAGTEILNQALKTSQQGEDATEVQVVYDPDDPYARGWGWWYFNEPQARDDRIIWTADFLPAGTYELSYILIPIQAGAFHVLPAHAWQAFFPDVQGTSAGMIFKITAK